MINIDKNQISATAANNNTTEVKGTFFQPFAINASMKAQGGIDNVLDNNGLLKQTLEL